MTADGNHRRTAVHVVHIVNVIFSLVTDIRTDFKRMWCYLHVLKNALDTVMIILTRLCDYGGGFSDKTGVDGVDSERVLCLRGQPRYFGISHISL